MDIEFFNTIFKNFNLLLPIVNKNNYLLLLSCLINFIFELTGYLIIKNASLSVQYENRIKDKNFCWG